MAEGLPAAFEDVGINDRHPLADIGAMTLMQRGVSFAVGAEGDVLRYPSGEPIDGDRIEAVVRGSGRTLTNAEAAVHIIQSDGFVPSVEARISELRTEA